MRTRHFIEIIPFILVGCVGEPEATKSYENAVALRVPYDTLRVDSEEESFVVEVFALEVKPDSGTRVQKGVLTSISESYYTFDSSEVMVNPGQVQWTISDETILALKKGKFTPLTSGICELQASLLNLTSSKIIVDVTANPNYPRPSLEFDNPAVTITLSEHGVIAGTVTYGSILEYAGNRIPYDSKGSFNTPVEGLSVGDNLLTVTATHPKNPNLKSSKEKTFTRLSPEEENQLIGSWRGTTATQDFYFEIEYSNGQFVVSGEVQIEDNSFDLSEDVVFEGLINSFGMVDTRLNKNLSAYEIKGKLTGVFESVGTAQGTYVSKISDGILSITLIEESWTAVKL